MAVQIMRLRGVPADEAEEVCALLTTHQIDYYQTPAGNWGISMPAIWLRDESQLVEARKLLDDYQLQRRDRAREDYERRKAEGSERSIIDEIRARPLRFLGYLLAAGVILYLSIMPFLEFGQ